VGMGLVLGAGIGVALGAATENLAIGRSLCASLGLLFGSIGKVRKRQPHKY